MLGKEGTLEKFRQKARGLDFFLYNASEGMLFPIIPLSIAAAFSAPALLIGLAESIPALLASSATFLPRKIKSGRLFRAASLALSAAMRPLLASSATFTGFLAFRSVDCAASSVAFARDSPQAPHARQLLPFAKNSAALLLGPILSLLLLFFFSSLPAQETYRSIFLLSAIPAALALIPLLLKNESRYHEESFAQPPKPEAIPPAFPPALLASSLFLLSKIGILLFLFKASEALSPPLILLAYVIFLASSMAFSLPSRIISETFSQKKTFILGCLVFSMAALSFSLGTNAQLTLLLFAFLGVSHSLLGCAKNGPSPTIQIAQHYSILSPLLLIAANLIAASLWEIRIASMHAPFLASCALSLAATLIFAVYAEEDS